MKTIFSLFILLSFIPTVAKATVFFVDSENCANQDEPYTSWSTAACDIQTALTSAAENDEIWVKAGKYNISNTIELSKKIILYGGFAGNENQIDERDLEINQTILYRNPTIIAKAGPKGSITPTGAVSVIDGENQNFIIQTNKGYHIDKVIVDGELKIQDNSETENDNIFLYSHTFEDVSSNHTIETEFNVNTYTIQPSAGAHGLISPNTIVKLEYGESQSFSISPEKDCYHIQILQIDGYSITVENSYSFTNVDRNHTIHAMFDVFNRDSKACYQNDVYWYDSCGNREDKYNECGNSGFDGNNYCYDNDVYKKYTTRGCSGDKCYKNTEPIKQKECNNFEGYVGENFCQNNDVYRNFVKRGCSNGICYEHIEAVKINNCNYFDGFDGTSYCYQNDVYGNYIKRGCSGGTCYSKLEQIQREECNEFEGFEGEPYCQNGDQYGLFVKQGCSSGQCFRSTESKMKLDCGVTIYGEWECTTCRRKRSCIHRDKTEISSCSNGYCSHKWTTANSIVNPEAVFCNYGNTECRGVLCCRNDTCQEPK